jgi:hypothetical protein
MHEIFFENLDVIIASDFYQVQLVHDARIFKTNMNNIDSLNTKVLDGKDQML